MKVTVIIGSVRKGGNSEILAKAFAEGAKDGGNGVTVLSVADLKISPCMGCNSCMANGGECVQRDDMAEIYRVLSETEVLCVASPVYFYGISAQVKAVLDRLHTPLRNEFKIKKTALLLSAASGKPTVFDAILCQYKLITDYFGLENIGSVCAGKVSGKGDALKTDYPKTAYLLGKSIKK